MTSTSLEWLLQRDAALAERDDLLRLLGEVRAALHAPEDVDVRERARQVAAKAQRWDGVPWDVIGAIIVGWELTNDIDDEIADLQQWFIASKGEVQR